MPWKTESRQKQRERLVAELLRGKESVAETCRHFGIARQTGYKFLRRFKAEGRRGLKDRSRQPHRCSQQRKKWQRRVVGLRKRWPTWGARKLRAKLRHVYPRQRLPSARTLGRWLGVLGLTRRRTHKRHAVGVKTTWTQACGPNAVWTVDFKGWFRTKSGQRIEPLTVRDHYSRYILAVEAIAVGVRPVRQVFRRLFARYGLPRAIRSDRGAPFCGSGPHGLTQLSLWWHRVGIRVEFADRRHHTDNNAHEQMHRVLQDEVAAHPCRTRRAQIAALRIWRHRFNHLRPHEALGQATPATRYRRSPRCPLRLSHPKYPATWLVRHVKPAGNITLHHRCYGVGRAFCRLPIGLRPLKTGSYAVYFDRLLLGYLHPLIDRSLTHTPHLEEGGGPAPSLHPPHRSR